MDIYFYHLMHANIEESLVSLLSLSRTRGWRVLLCFTTQEFLNHVDKWLWEHNPSIVHGAEDQDFAADQPVLLSLTHNNINKAEICFLIEGASYREGNFKRVAVLFDGLNEQNVVTARAQWQAFQALGCKMNYYKQNASGKWELLKTHG